MATIKEYLDYAELAQASYIDGFQVGMTGTGYGTGKDDILTKKEFTQTQADIFANRYKVLAVRNDANGFNATLFQDMNTGKKILSIRGTEPSSPGDISADLSMIFGSTSDQYTSLVSFFDELKSSGTIKTSDNLVVTGHSLGGALTQMITATYPDYVDEAYTFNSPGAANLNIPPLVAENGKYYIRYVADELGTEISADLYYAYLSFDANKTSVDGKVTSIYAQEGSEVATGLGGGLMGTIIPISIDPNTLDAQNHQLPYTTQSLYIYNMLSSIANTQDLNLLTSILENVTNESVVEVIAKAFSDEQPSTNLIDQAIALTNDNKGKAEGLINLTDKSSAQLNNKSLPNLYALINLNPFAIEGNLPAYKTIDASNYSDMFFANRADYLYYTLGKHNRYDVVPRLQDYQDFSLGSDYDLIKNADVGKVLFGGDINNTASQMQGADQRDYLFGMGGNDTIEGNGGDDYLEGGAGKDTLKGGKGNDTLIGGYSTKKTDTDADTLEGGAGKDTYYAGDKDTIYDSNGQGTVVFEGITLSQGRWNEQEQAYIGDGGRYTFDKMTGTLTFTVSSGTDKKTLTIKNYHKDNNSLNIHLTDKKDPLDNLPETGAGIFNAGSFSSPLVLDLNKDGVTSQDLYDTNTHFDMNTDGFKERTAWIQKDDGLLVFDKNQDDIINNGSELFGDNTTLSNGTKATNGFEALKEYDSNKDGVIDNKDNIYDNLKVWIDANSDGVSGADELKTLSDLGITSINLNSTSTTDTELQNNISDTSTFTQNGETKTLNDVWFATDTNDTAYEHATNISDTVLAMPNIKNNLLHAPQRKCPWGINRINQMKGVA